MPAPNHEQLPSMRKRLSIFEHRVIVDVFVERFENAQVICAALVLIANVGNET